VLVIAHQAVLRAIYAYFHSIPPEQCTRLPIPLHRVLELRPHAYGCQEVRMSLSR
jgi:6-phosphofructo-2-kinase/fructose-2,6-biphosphatase 2